MKKDADRCNREGLLVGDNLYFTYAGDSFFRYCNPAGLDILDNLRLFAKQPASFNDPFEFLPYYSLKTSNRALIDHTIELHRSYWEQSLNDGKELVGLTESEIRKSLSTKLVQSLLSDYRSTIPKKMEEQQRLFTEKVGRQIGLVCFSEVETDLLMWSHYADMHKGIVIEFDAHHPFFGLGSKMVPVIYSNKRVLVAHDLDGPDLSDLFLRVFRTKSRHWQYEKEWRQFCLKEDWTLATNADGTESRFYKIPADLVKSVILGVRASETLIENVQALLQREHFKGRVTLKQAKLHAKRFRIEVVEFS